MITKRITDKIIFLFSVLAGMTVSLSNTGPAVLGSSVTFTATVSNYDGSTQLKYVFWDDAEPQHRDSVCIIQYYFLFLYHFYFTKVRAYSSPLVFEDIKIICMWIVFFVQ